MLPIKFRGQQSTVFTQQNFAEFLETCLHNQNSPDEFLPHIDLSLIISLIENFVVYAADRSQWLDIEPAKRQALFAFAVTILKQHIEPNISLIAGLDQDLSSATFLRFLQLVDYIDELRPAAGASQQDFMQQIAMLIDLQKTISAIALRWIEHIDVNYANSNGDTPLHLVATGMCCSSEQQIVTALFRHGANVETLNLDNKSPFILALDANKEHVLKAMLENRALNTPQLLTLLSSCDSRNFKIWDLIPDLVAALPVENFNQQAKLHLLNIIFEEFDRLASSSGNRPAICARLSTPVASLLEAILSGTTITSNSRHEFSSLQQLINTNQKMYLFGMALRKLAIKVFSAGNLSTQTNLLHYFASGPVNCELVNEQLLAQPNDSITEVAANMLKAAKHKEGQEASLQEYYALEGNFSFILLICRARQAAKIIIDDSSLTSAMKQSMHKCNQFSSAQHNDLKLLLKYLGNFIWPKYERRLYADLVNALESQSQLFAQLGLSEFNTWTCQRPFMSFMSRPLSPIRREADTAKHTAVHNLKPQHLKFKRGSLTPK